jgi:hypothetical protein
MIEITPPNTYQYFARSVFLAGGISNCPNWQKDLIAMLESTNLGIFNPRQDNYTNNQAAATTQIQWEHTHLRMATAISFWFPSQTLCPITLYELGYWSSLQKPIFIGVHPDFERKLDVSIQTSLVVPEIKIVDSLEALAGQLIKYDSSK